MKNRRAASLSNTISYTLLCSAALLFLHSLFFQSSHDWDVDAFLYLGSRLDYKEILFVDSFETKLPLLQYIFYLPSKLGGIGAWRIITFVTAIVFGTYASYFFALECADNTGFSLLSPRQLALLILGFFLVTLYSLPGSESGQIEIVSASAAYLSLVLLLRSISLSDPAYNFSSGFFLAFSALIRPNYIYLLPVFALWTFIVCARVRDIYYSIVTTAWLCVGFTTVILVTFLPYMLFDGGPSALIDGLWALGRFSDGIDPWSLTKKQLRGVPLFYSAMYTGCVLLLFWSIYKLKWYTLRSGILIICSISSINLSIVWSHYYNHYTIMFAPFAVLVACLLLLLILEATSGLLKINLYYFLGVIFFSLFLATPFWTVLAKLRAVQQDSAGFDWMINRRGIDGRFLKFLEVQKRKGRTFLVADAPIYHMLLGERRIGDGHPAMLISVLYGKKIGPISDIRIYTDEIQRKPCLALLKSDKDWIISSRQRFQTQIDQCLSTERRRYQKIQIPKFEQYSFFVKKSILSADSETP